MNYVYVCLLDTKTSKQIARNLEKKYIVLRMNVWINFYTGKIYGSHGIWKPKVTRAVLRVTNSKT